MKATKAMTANLVTIYHMNAKTPCKSVKKEVIELLREAGYNPKFMKKVYDRAMSGYVFHYYEENEVSIAHLYKIPFTRLSNYDGMELSIKNQRYG